ncbi:hypothetical protein ES702_03033 [subsurface metagenome]
MPYNPSLIKPSVDLLLGLDFGSGRVSQAALCGRASQRSAVRVAASDLREHRATSTHEVLCLADPLCSEGSVRLYSSLCHVSILVPRSMIR